MSMKIEDMIKIAAPIAEKEETIPVVITSSNETKEPDMSLRRALDTLMKYAALLEEERIKASQKEEDEVSDKTGH